MRWLIGCVALMTACSFPDVNIDDSAGGGGGAAGSCADADGDMAFAPPCGNDCNDDDADVFPDQGRWFDVPIDGATSKPFDYDCSGIEERELATVECNAALMVGCSGEGVFISATELACGSSGDFGSCDLLCMPQVQLQQVVRCH